MPLRVADPVAPAFDRALALLSSKHHPRPYRRYALLALAAAFTLLGEGGSSEILLSLGLTQTSDTGQSPELLFLQNAFAWSQLHPVQAITYFTLFTTAACILYLLYRWLNSRGEFMLLDAAVGIDTASFKQNFTRHRPRAYALFKFHLYWDLTLFNYFFFAALLCSLLCIPDFKPMLEGNPYRWSAWTTAAIALCTLLFLAGIPLVWFFSNTFYHLAIPLMYLRNIDPWPAFKLALRSVARPHLRATLLYFLMMIVANSAANFFGSLTAFLSALLTCGLALLLGLLPLLGSLTLFAFAIGALPAMLFQRTYALLFLRQLFPDFHTPWPPPFPVQSPATTR
jgi:hypothetical protein